MQSSMLKRSATRYALFSALDRGTMLLSGLCLIHCLALPIAVTLLPLAAANLFSDPRFHGWLLWAVVPTSALALFFGCRHHRDFRILFAGTIAVGIVAFAALGGSWAGFGERGETVLTVIGGLLLAAAHLANIRLHRHSAVHAHG